MRDYYSVVIWTAVAMGAAFLVFWGMFRQIKRSSKRKKELDERRKN